MANRLGLVAICLGYFVVILDATVVNVALPAIQRDFAASIAQLQWIVDGYALVFASLLLTGGALGDRLGSRRAFLSGLVIFTAASLLCGAAPALGSLQVARALQGIGAALLVPSSLALINHAFDTPRERSYAIGTWGSIGGIAAGTGPVLGGFLVGALGWRSVFLINLPVSLVAALLLVRYVAPTRPHASRSLDIAAQVVGIASLGCLTFGFIEAGPLGWRSPVVLAALILGALGIAAFVALERSAASPMLPLDLFRNRRFSASTFIGWVLNFGFYGQLFVLSLFFQHVRGDSPGRAGLALLPETGIAIVSSGLSGRVVGRIGPRLPMVLGLAIGAAGLFGMQRVDAATPYPSMLGFLLAIGIGMSFTMPAATAATMAAAPEGRAGIAAGVLNSSRQVGGVIGVALLGALVGEGAFVAQMHLAFLLAGSVYLLGCLIAYLHSEA